jgi:hypothetical protein
LERAKKAVALYFNGVVKQTKKSDNFIGKQFFSIVIQSKQNKSATEINSLRSKKY